VGCLGKACFDMFSHVRVLISRAAIVHVAHFVARGASLRRQARSCEASARSASFTRARARSHRTAGLTLRRPADAGRGAAGGPMHAQHPLRRARLPAGGRGRGGHLRGRHARRRHGPVHRCAAPRAGLRQTLTATERSGAMCAGTRCCACGQGTSAQFPSPTDTCAHWMLPVQARW